jgi:hypothetical protein
MSVPDIKLDWNMYSFHADACFGEPLGNLKYCNALITLGQDLRLNELAIVSTLPYTVKTCVYDLVSGIVNI